MKLHKKILFPFILLSVLMALASCSVSVTEPLYKMTPGEEIQLHPDLSPATEEAHEVFKEISAPERYYMGTLHRESWYHDGRDKTITSLYMSLDAEQYAELVGFLGSVEDICGQGDRTEIQVYSSDESLNQFLSEHVGKDIIISANDVFEAHTIYHRRNIVMDVKTAEVVERQLSGQGHGGE